MTRLRCALAAILIFLAVTTVGGVLIRLVEQQRQQEQTLRAKHVAEDHAQALQLYIDHSISLTHVLASLLRQRGDIPDFQALSADLMGAHGAIGALHLAPDGVIRDSYPSDGKGYALGHDLFADPVDREQTQAARQQRRLLLSGPLQLQQQSDRVLVALQPVFVNPPHGTEVFWGFTLAVIRVGDILAGGDLEQMRREDGYDFRVTRVRSATDYPVVAQSTALPLHNPVVLDLQVAGERWQFAVAPHAGWDSSAFLTAASLLLVVLAGVIAFMSYGLLRQPALLRRQVAMRTETLAHTNRLLEEEAHERRRAAEALRRSEERFRTLIEASSDWVWEVDEHAVYTYCSPKVQEILGYAPEEVLGKRAYDFMAPEEAQRVNALAKPLAAAGKPMSLLENTRRHRDGHEVVLETSGAPILDRHGHFRGYRGVDRDVTERKAALEKIRRLARTHTVLSQINHAMVRLRDRDALFAEACAIAVRAGAFRMAWVCVAENGGYRIAASDGETAYLKRFEAYLQESEDPEPALHAIRSGLSCVDDQLAAVDSNAAWRAVAVACGLRSAASFPLKLDDRVMGSIALYSADTDFFDDHEMALLDELAGDISFAVQTMGLEERRRQAEEDLRLSARVFENSAEGIIITDAENRILKVNRAFCTVTGYSEEEVIGQNPHVLSSGLQDSAFYRNLWQSLNSTGQWQGEIWNRRKNGDFYPEWLNISVVKDPAGGVTNYVAVFTDITSRKEIEQHLNYLAYYDVLTGLPNRTLFYDRLRQAAAQAERNRQVLAVMFIDLDRFKVINDTLGHAMGDLVLKEAAARITGCVRHGDTVSRLGGDEFTVILSHMGDTGDASVVAGKIIEALGRPFHLEEHEVFISGSIGISVFPEDGENLEVLVKNADTAMYRAKELGRDNYQFYRAEMNERAAERLEMETGLRHALERSEFELYYQPKVELATGRILGAEALLRWNRPGHGLVNPGEFIDLLEETGLILAVGRWALHQACVQSRRWADAGHDLVVAVNFSTRQFREHEVVTAVRAALDATGLDPRRLEIELTESMIMQYAEETVSTLRALKAMGLRLAIDDFGTGYSSFAYLKRFPIDILKIDQSFVRDIPGDPDDSAIASAIIAMAHQLKLKVIAEGVETREQLAFLTERGCDEIQGYLIGEPQTAAEFERLLARAPAVVAD